MNGPESVGIEIWRWLLAVLPVLLLAVLVLDGRIRTSTTAVIAALTAGALGAIAFGAGPRVLAVALGKGVWRGIWILYVIGPALLLYYVAEHAGLTRIGGLFSSVMPTPVENVLVVAWVVPSFIQGVAGFGTPIAVSAPILVAMGLPKVRALALPLVGYHWAVTFGSMGSSYYMGALTANVSGSEATAYATSAAVILAVNALVAGALVCLIYGGWSALRRAAPTLLPVGTAMGLTLVAVARVEPAIASLSAGTVGLLAVAVSWRLRRNGPSIRSESLRSRQKSASTGLRSAVVIGLPYLYLLASVLAVFVPTASRHYAQSHLLIGPSFPATATTLGTVNEAVDIFTPIALLGHPGTFLLGAAMLGWLTYRVLDLQGVGQLRSIAGRWAPRFGRSVTSIASLTVLASVLVDAGMTEVLAAGIASAFEDVFLPVSPVIGAVGSFMTGSTTTSNALFSALQRDVALLAELPVPLLLATQTAGGNVGNAIAPVVILVGAATIEAQDEIPAVSRVVAPSVIVLLTVVAGVAGLLLVT